MSKWTVADVMTTEVVSVPLDAGYRTVVDTLVEHRISAVPVVDPLRTRTSGPRYATASSVTCCRATRRPSRSPSRTAS
ncbi:CBS domain-containing protein [Actinoplanes sp. NPDC051633]|uniref:CBS domain-containing protein n=1 Tax=Actinoplanes sp. NPDC051633 TaxID=3155670 RepID=UPI003427F23C